MQVNFTLYCSFWCKTKNQLEGLFSRSDFLFLYCTFIAKLLNIARLHKENFLKQQNDTDTKSLRKFLIKIMKTTKLLVLLQFCYLIGCFVLISQLINFAIKYSSEKKMDIIFEISVIYYPYIHAF